MSLCLPSCDHSSALKGVCLVAVLSDFESFLRHYVFLEGSASERRQPSRASGNQNGTGLHAHAAKQSRLPHAFPCLTKACKSIRFAGARVAGAATLRPHARKPIAIRCAAVTCAGMLAAAAPPPDAFPSLLPAKARELALCFRLCWRTEGRCRQCRRRRECRRSECRALCLRHLRHLLRHT